MSGFSALENGINTMNPSFWLRGQRHTMRGSVWPEQGALAECRKGQKPPSQSVPEIRNSTLCNLSSEPSRMWWECSASRDTACTALTLHLRRTHFDRKTFSLELSSTPEPLDRWQSEGSQGDGAPTQVQLLQLHCKWDYNWGTRVI